MASLGTSAEQADGISRTRRFEHDRSPHCGWLSRRLLADWRKPIAPAFVGQPQLLFFTSLQLLSASGWNA